MTLPPHRNSPTPRSSRLRSLGNILIVASLVLIGAALAMAATADRSTAVTPPSRIAGATPTATSGSPVDARAIAPAAIQSAPQPTTHPSRTATPAPASADVSQEAVAAATPEPSPTPIPDRPPAEHIRIPAVGIDTTVVEVGYEIVTVGDQQVMEWAVADYAAGHHNLSADPGEGGNIVITGHDDWRGEVFRTLEFVELGNEVVLTTSEGEHRYVVEEIHFRREVGVSLEERLATGMFLAPMDEERVTLVTCWPYGVNDHRIIVVARPASS